MDAGALRQQLCYSSRKKDLVSQQIKTKYLTQIYMILREKVRFRPINLPDFSKNTPAIIEEIAEEVRDYWQLGDSPIPNMVALLEKNGIVVGEFATDSREIDAFYQYTEEEYEPVFCVVLGTDKKSFYSTPQALSWLSKKGRISSSLLK